MKIQSTLITLLSLLSLTLASSAQTENYIRTKAERDAMSPQEILASIKAGNERFLEGVARPRSFRQEQLATKGGQHPGAVVLSCIDSRAPAEVVFDKGIGEIFNARVAGNVANPDIVGSIEFACANAGAKVVLVIGHSRCGAVNAAIDGVQGGQLTVLLDRVHPAVEASKHQHPGPYASSNESFAQLVTRQNVELTIDQIRRISPTLQELEKKGQIIFQGAVYDLATGAVTFL